MRVGSLKDKLRALPAQALTEADQHRRFNEILRQVSDDLHRRLQAEFMRCAPGGKEAPAPKYPPTRLRLGLNLSIFIKGTGRHPECTQEYPGYTHSYADTT